MAWRLLMDRDETEVVQELATSLAPVVELVSEIAQVNNRKADARLTNVPRVQEREDGADGKDVVVLVKRHGVLVWRRGNDLCSNRLKNEFVIERRVAGKGETGLGGPSSSAFIFQKAACQGTCASDQHFSIASGPVPPILAHPGSAALYETRTGFPGICPGGFSWCV
jgi:hypothetical protein